MRYRMVGLELPELTQEIDSVYRKDRKRFENLVIKREEEHRLINSIESKRSEIKDLDR